jgi:PPOX class probable F420-dependent enzyme
MDISKALSWAQGHSTAALITLRRDGRAQSSDIAYAVMGNTFNISLTDSRAKTVNMRRDNRVVLHISEPSAWSYVSIDATVELSPVCTTPNDATADELVAVYQAVTGGEHSDWGEFRRAMVDEGRIVARVTPVSVTGQIN